MTSVDSLRTQKSLRGLSARVAGSGKLPTPLKLAGEASDEPLPSFALPSPSLPSPSLSLSFASSSFDTASSSAPTSGSTAPTGSFPSTPDERSLETPAASASPSPVIKIVDSENSPAPSKSKQTGAKMLGLAFSSSSAKADTPDDEPLEPPKRPSTFRTRSTSFHALTSSFRSNSAANANPATVPSSPAVASASKDKDSHPLANATNPTATTWTHRLSIKLRPRKSVPNLRAQSSERPPLPASSAAADVVLGAPVRPAAGSRSASSSPRLQNSNASALPLPPPQDPFAPDNLPPLPPPRSRSTSFAAAVGGGGGLKSPRLSPSMLDLALEARGLIQLEGRTRKASAGPLGATSSADSMVSSTLSSVSPSPLSVSQASTGTTSTAATSVSTSTYRTSASSSKHMSDSPRSPKTSSFGHLPPATPPPTSPLPPIPTDASWRAPSPSPTELSTPSPVAGPSSKKEDLKGLGLGTSRSTSGAGGREERGRGRSGYTGESDLPAGAARQPIPTGPNRPRRVDGDGDKGNAPSRDRDERRKPDPPAGRDDDEDSETDESSSSSDSSDSDEDDDDEEGPARRAPVVTSPKVDGDSDDDVPLAVAHPSALTVQKSLRLTRKKEKLERKLREKKLDRGKSPPNRRREPTGASMTTNATGQSREHSQRRQRAPPKDLPSAYGQGMEGIWAAEELEKKLLDHLSGSGVGGGSGTVRSRKASASGPAGLHEESGGTSRSGGAHGGEYSSSTLPRSRAMEKSRTLPLPPPPPPPPMDVHAPTSSFASLGLGRAKSQTQPARQRGASNQPIPTPSSSDAHRPSVRRRPSEPALAPSPVIPPPLPASTNFPLPPARPRPSLPHLLTSNSATPSHTSRPSPPRSPGPVATETTRMFLDKMGGRAVEVEIGSTTTAGHVLDLLKRRGELEKRDGDEMMAGGWTVWEGGNDWGIERPLREYELLNEVSSSWNRETRLNAFIVKRCRISNLLGVGAVPNQCPNVIGWVQCEVKKGKWSKRFLEIRDGSVWLCKNERGKDETFLCSMSAYDLYSFTRPYKSPSKTARVWALKSQDKIQFFEKPTDYIHIFTSDERTWETMWRGITQCRSHALTLSNPALFRSSPTTAAHQPTYAHHQTTSANPHSVGHSVKASPNLGSIASPTMGPGAGPSLINPASLEFGVAPGGGVGLGVGLAPGGKGLFEKGSLLGKMHG